MAAGCHDGWRTMSAAVADFSESAFVSVMNMWIDHPERVMPPLEKAVLNGDEASGSLLKERRVERTLVSRRRDRDADLAETADIAMSELADGEFVVAATFTPRVDAAASLPFYYPAVRAYRFVFASSAFALATFMQTSLDADENELRRWQELCDAATAPDASHHSSDGDQGRACYALHVQRFADFIGDSAKVAQSWARLFRKVRSWSRNTDAGYRQRVHFEQHIDAEAYRSTYAVLKERHSHWVDCWPEVTDPSKFVFEDLHIAAYIITLWRGAHAQGRGPERPRFIDLGCGNGFLTYVLTNEGYTGRGVDIAKRKIWDMLSGADLRVEVIDPTTVTFDDVDWIIGNHADELVPWIPVIAARSPPHVSFFTIPCCLFDFGARFQSRDLSRGRYAEYLAYVRRIAEKCGFEVDEETLRIPSTKNAALIGQRRLHLDPQERENRITELIRASGFTAFTARLPDKVLQDMHCKRKAHNRHKRAKTDSDVCAE